MLEGDDLLTRAMRGTLAGAAVFACVGLMAAGTRAVSTGDRIDETILARLSIGSTGKSASPAFIDSASEGRTFAHARGNGRSVPAATPRSN
jgi:hypothetical protein